MLERTLRGQRGRAGLRGSAGLLAAGAAAAVVLVACNTQASVHSAAPTTVSTAPATTAATTTTTTTDPGQLPQTRDKPVADGAMFNTGVNGLWEAIVNDDPRPAMPFFFPLSAYLQVKALSDPAADWQNRLVAAYDRDIHTLHLSLGPNAASAQLAGIDLPESQAQWINPGVESNKIGYWRVYGTRLRYTIDGKPQSFAVTSLISWRGEWYVVHLGPISG